MEQGLKLGDGLGDLWGHCEPSWHGKPRSRSSRKALSLVLRQQYWPCRRFPIASAGSSVSQFFGARNFYLEAESHSSSSPDLKSLAMHWSRPLSKAQRHEDPRSSAASGVRHLQPPSNPQPGFQVRPHMAMGVRGPRCALLCSLGLSLFPGAQLSRCFVSGQWRQASLALFPSTLDLFISCRQTAHIMLAFHAQYS